MSGNVVRAKGARSSRATKPDIWYFDQLPPSARQALANAAFSWSAAWIYSNWKRAASGFKTGQQCAERIAKADRKYLKK